MLMVEEGQLPDGTVDSLQGGGSPDQDAEREDNIIQLEFLQGYFKLSVTGFDMHRDLRIKTIP